MYLHSIDMQVMAYLAEVHVQGKAFTFEATTPEGKTEVLLDLPNYDFNWQLRYDYAQFRLIPQGSHLKITAAYDNSIDNPANPDPTKTSPLNFLPEAIKGNSDALSD